MKRNFLSLVSCFALSYLLFSGIGSVFVIGDEGPPSQAMLFNGHDFSENYWDIMVTNNSNWDHPDVNPMISWYNNTWNVKWIKEDNFEMGMFAFMNKTQWDMGQENTFTTPAQMWWQHAHIAGSEIIIASIHSAWYGFGDHNYNRVYDEGSEELSPYFFMGANTQEVRNTGIISNPKTIAYSLARSVSGSIVTYTWGYKYENIIFFVPNVDRSNPAHPFFNWGFNYSDPGTYVEGSHHIGNMTYFEYQYTLEIDTSAGVSTLHQDYETGEIDSMVYRDSNLTTTFLPASYPDDHWVPPDFAMCLGTYSFIWAKQDWALTHLGGAINRTLHESGLSTVETYLGGVHAFDFKFTQKPEYTITNKSNLVTGTYNVSYECLDVLDPEFMQLVSGMTDLVGKFGRVVIGYVINQTNTFVHGITFDDAYNQTDPENMAAFFVSCYPEYGAYGGGSLSHDPVFVMYFTASGAIPGFDIFILLSTLTIGVTTAVLISRRKKVNI
ncbi:MAG: hypothetical protein ACFE9R_12965 [Candidatus Hermodarchaeota archaeon]